jgi:PAS domain S-box-containing protein
MTARLEHQLEMAQQITHIGSWEWDPRTEVVTWSNELYRIYGLEPRSCEITFPTFLARVHPDDRDRIQAEVGRALEGDGRFAYVERIVRPDGSVRNLDTVGEVVRDAQGNVAGLIGTCRDVTLEVRAERLKQAETRVLEMVAAGHSLEDVLATLVLAIEEQVPETLGSILLLEGRTVRHGAAPSLPAAYNQAIDGRPIGPAEGSCGTAAHLGRPVFVTDIDTDPLWDSYRELARNHGLRACWSTPIFSGDGRVLGTFALYYRTPRSPNPVVVELIARATHLAGIAIQRRELDEQFRALSAHIESVREEERTSVAREIHDVLGQALTALRMDVTWILRRSQKTEASAAIVEKLEGMSRMTEEIIDQVRRISTDLRPGVLDDLGLVAALEWQANDFEQRTTIPCVFDANVPDVRYERNLSTAVFRIFQEALTNVARHAEATRVNVRLGHDEKCLFLEIEDDGKGITAEAISSTTSLGLLGIRERVRRFGGTVSVSGEPGKGTRVALEIPQASNGGGN